LGAGFTAHAGYTGYQQEGAWGAAKGVGESLAIWYAGDVAISALARGGPWAAAIGVGAATAGLGMIGEFTGENPLQVLARPAVREHMRKYAKLEMGRPVIDQFGTGATMRQRSLMAMQRSKINGRSALGNEATLMYRPYFR
jgi:hypothetical protein